MNSNSKGQRMISSSGGFKYPKLNSIRPSEKKEVKRDQSKHLEAYGELYLG